MLDPNALIIVDCCIANLKAEKVEQRNKAYYSKYPEDASRVKQIYQYLQENTVSLPLGRLTTSRIQQLGILFGMHGMQISSKVNDILC